MFVTEMFNFVDCEKQVQDLGALGNNSHLPWLDSQCDRQHDLYKTGL